MYTKYIDINVIQNFQVNISRIIKDMGPQTRKQYFFFIITIINGPISKSYEKKYMKITTLINNNMQIICIHLQHYIFKIVIFVNKMKKNFGKIFIFFALDPNFTENNKRAPLIISLISFGLFLAKNEKKMKKIV